MKVASTCWESPASLEQLRDQAPSSAASVLIQVFWGRRDYQGISELQRQLCDVFGEAPVIGTTTAGEILDGQVCDEAVVVSAAWFERAWVVSEREEGGDMAQVGSRLARKLSQAQTPQLVIAFLNGHLNGEAFARGVGESRPDLPLAGGLAGDGTRFHKTLVFDAHRIVHNGAVAAALCGPIHVHQHFNFNWHAIGPKFRITRAEGNIVREINGMLAQAFYARYLGDEAMAYMPAIAMEFPLIFERHGQPVARACLKVLDDGALLYAGEVPEGQKAQFGVGAHHQILQDSCIQSRQLVGRPVEGIFVYSCVARRQLLGDNIHHELRPLADIAPVAGFFTYGELAHLGGGNTLLNQTMTLVALAEGEHSVDRTPVCPRPPTDFKDVMLRAMAHLATQVSEDLEQLSRKYRDLAEHDLLTGLYNRRAGEQLLRKELARAARHGYPLSVAILDMDHFKRINDTHGHAAGDQVLRHWGQFLAQQLRSSDFVVRWGGEEILLILPMTARADARKRLESMLEQFRTQSIRAGSATLSGLTFSAGVAQLRGHDSPDALLDQADHALYRAKAAGRACVMI